MRGQSIIYLPDGEVIQLGHLRTISLTDLGDTFKSIPELVTDFDQIKVEDEYEDCAVYIDKMAEKRHLPRNNRAMQSWQVTRNPSRSLQGPVVVLFGDRDFMAPHLAEVEKSKE